MSNAQLFTASVGLEQFEQAKAGLDAPAMKQLTKFIVNYFGGERSHASPKHRTMDTPSTVSPMSASPESDNSKQRAFDKNEEMESMNKATQDNQEELEDRRSEQVKKTLSDVLGSTSVNASVTMEVGSFASSTEEWEVEDVKACIVFDITKRMSGPNESVCVRELKKILAALSTDQGCTLVIPGDIKHLIDHGGFNSERSQQDEKPNMNTRDEVHAFAMPAISPGGLELEQHIDLQIASRDRLAKSHHPLRSKRLSELDREGSVLLGGTSVTFETTFPRAYPHNSSAFIETLDHHQSNSRHVQGTIQIARSNFAAKSRDEQPPRSKNVPDLRGQRSANDITYQNEFHIFEADLRELIKKEIGKHYRNHCCTHQPPGQEAKVGGKCDGLCEHTEELREENCQLKKESAELKTKLDRAENGLSLGAQQVIELQVELQAIKDFPRDNGQLGSRAPSDVEEAQIHDIRLRANRKISELRLLHVEAPYSTKQPSLSALLNLQSRRRMNNARLGRVKQDFEQLKYNLKKRSELFEAEIGFESENAAPIHNNHRPTPPTYSVDPQPKSFRSSFPYFKPPKELVHMLGVVQNFDDKVVSTALQGDIKYFWILYKQMERFNR
ncbi:hypothetical protein BJ875DRAFT_442077 [Amylocarpus encephaloides]|uniref:Uncharacterized protein n=1 Tax=Amylocarpus encephaloides TaxID=45428 RepID=A0A9P8C4K2_9HELO|nr:hypothetical protein BJ875DRAFT_442077 [Amylocarpus encephaloides]